MAAESSPNAFQSIAWPAARLGEALAQLAQRADRRSTAPGEVPPPIATSGTEFDQWLDGVAQRLGLEAEPIQYSYGEVAALLRGIAPALLRLEGATSAAEPLFLLVVRGGRRWVTVLGPDLASHRLPAEQIHHALCTTVEAPYASMVEGVLQRARVAPQRLPVVRRALFNGQLGRMPLGGCWLVRLAPGASLWSILRQVRLGRTLWLLLVALFVQQALYLASWWVIGRSALNGHFDWGWLTAWLLLLFTTVPLLMATVWLMSRVAVDAGGIFKARLLFGALQLEPEEIRHQGAGQFLGRVMESEAVEGLALAGGLMAVLALFQLGFAASVLALGAGGWFHALLLVIWLGVALGLGWLDWRRALRWADAYRAMTNDLVERMVGHRTRLAQEARHTWHETEDQLLAHYWSLSRQRDQIESWFAALPRGWMVVGLAGLVPALLTTPTPTTGLAVGLGGILLTLTGLTTLTSGLQSVVQALVAWRQVRPLFQAATRPPALPAVGAVLASVQATAVTPGQPILVAQELSFRYAGRRPVLQGCTLQIHAGDRLLLEGPSGGGKSTLAALLAGLRTPESGLLLLWGFDANTLGSPLWRRRVVNVPQFHENHLFTGTLAFNLLLGRRWPAGPADLAEAEALCRELGLGPLLDRMPTGLQTMVGESGWRLSHGERSRVYMARALLQGSDLLIFDESFAALDPETMRMALTCVLRRAPTLLVIAHP